MTALAKLPPYYTERMEDYVYLGYKFVYRWEDGEHVITVSKDGEEIGVARGIYLEAAASEAVGLGWRGEE